MDKSLFMFTEFATSVRDRGNVVCISEIPSLTTDGEAFINTLLFDSNFLAYVNNTKTVSGYRGVGYMPYFPIDFDGTVETARENLIKVTTFLSEEGVPVENFLYYFSGNKGFHVLIPNTMIGSEPSDNISRVMHNFANSLFDDMNYDSTIYNHVRLFRLKNSKHGKSGLYKIPLTYKEVMLASEDDIRLLAKEKRNIEIKKYAGEPVQFLRYMWEQSKSNAGSIADVKPADESGEYKQVCYRNMFNNGAKEGYRNNTLLRAAWVLKKHSGIPFDMAVTVLRKWNEEKNSPPIDEEEFMLTVRQAYKGIYNFGCSDQILSMYCDDSCPIKKKYLQKLETTETSFPTMANIGSSYLSFIDSYNKNKLGFGHAAVDKYIRGLLPSTIGYVLARSGVGKTSFTVDCISRIIDRWNVPVMLFSLEMSKEMIFERMMSRFLKYNFSKIPTITENKDLFLNNVADMQKKYQKLIICDKSALKISDMEEYAKIVENNIIGEKLRVIFIDYLGLIRSDKASEYERVSDVVYDIQAWAKRSKATIVTLAQTGREKGGSGSTELELDAGRGSGVIEETADLMLGLWRTSNEKSEAIQLKILKNRFGVSGNTFTCDVNFELQHWDLHENLKIRS